MTQTMTLTDEQIMIRDAAADFLAAQCDSATLRKTVDAAFAGEGDGVDAQLWQALGQELGYCGLSLPEAAGGLHLGMTELVLVMEQLGKRLAPVPFFQSSVLAAGVLQYAVELPQAQSALEKLADGSQVASLLWPSALGVADAAQCTITAKADGAHYVLSGAIKLAFSGKDSDFFVVPARLADSHELAIFILPQGVTGLQIKPVQTWDTTRVLADVKLDHVSATASMRVAKGAAAQAGMQEALARANLGLAAEALGGAQQVLDLTLAYTAERVQFGRTIASYQAIKHRAALMMVKIESLRSALMGAAHSWDTATSAAALQAAACDTAAARMMAEDAYFYCAQDSIQLHGGVGFTWEYDPHLYYKRAQAARTWLGGVDAATDTILQGMLAAPAAQAAADEHPLRKEVADWMRANLTGKFAVLKERGGPGDDEAYPELRKEWEQHMAKSGWTCVGWPKEHGGRGMSVWEQVIFQEEYARAGGPGRMGHIGEGLLGLTVLALGTQDQKDRFLPGIQQGTEFWCQGYSEPSAGSDLANVRTRAVQNADGDWLITGQKVWTSWALESDWIFVIARTEEGSQGNKGLSFFLMPLKQAGVEIRPIKQITGGAEFNEVFFDQALAKKENIIGAVGDGWKVAMALLGFERGISTLGQQMQFIRELQWVLEIAQSRGLLSGAQADVRIRERVARAWAGLRVMYASALRMLGDTSGNLSREALAYKYYWSNWHRDLGELAMAVLGQDANVRDGEENSRATRLQNIALFARSDTIYAGTNEIQLNIISERGLNMPREPRGR